MHVEERQRVHQHVVGGPLPGVGQRVQGGGDGPAGDDGALGRAGGAGGVDDRGRVLPRRPSGSVGGGSAGPASCTSTSTRAQGAAGPRAVRRRARRARVPARCRTGCAPSSLSPGLRVQRHGGHPGQQRRDHADGRLQRRASPIRRPGRAPADRGPPGRRRRRRVPRTSGTGRRSAGRAGRRRTVAARAGKRGDTRRTPCCRRTAVTMIPPYAAECRRNRAPARCLAHQPRASLSSRSRTSVRCGLSVAPGRWTRKPVLMGGSSGASSGTTTPEVSSPWQR